MEQRINNIIGQLEGAKNMIKNEQDRDCYGILNQLKASKSGINSLMDKLLEEDILECVQGKDQREKQKIKKLIQELLKNN